VSKESACDTVTVKKEMENNAIIRSRIKVDFLFKSVILLINILKPVKHYSL
jgi:hypothetical protein